LFKYKEGEHLRLHSCAEGVKRNAKAELIDGYHRDGHFLKLDDLRTPIYDPQLVTKFEVCVKTNHIYYIVL
jgi:hypothetical protein